jgi:hypothetical protein
MMLVMLVGAMFGVVGSRMKGAVEGTTPKIFFVFFTLLSPMLLLVVLTAARQLMQFLGGRQPRGTPRSGP